MIKKEKKNRDDVFFNFGVNVHKEKQRKVKQMKNGIIDHDIDLEDFRNLSSSECLDLCKDELDV